MLFNGKLLAVGSKEEIRANPHPRVQQFLNRVPDSPVHTPALASYLGRYVQMQEVNHDH
jgi:ABC-type transporter Mla maintaining outer membrane lipid asymmetry ATPase subunit MlaF